MIVLSFIESAEFYVILFTVAAAVVGLCVRPASPKTSATYIRQGLRTDRTDADSPSIAAHCGEGNTVVFTRSGIELSPLDEVSYILTVSGFEITIEEHIVRVPATGTDCNSTEPSALEFTLSGLTCERYHVRFESRQNSLLAVFTLTVHEGFTASRVLTH